MYQHYEFKLKPLSYCYDALEPYIDAKTMQLHHDKHLQAYVNNLNNVLKDYPTLQGHSLEQLLTRQLCIPIGIKTSILNNAGGVYNHNFYFDGMINPSEKKPSGTLLKAIEHEYGSFSNFKDKFSAEALTLFGSGYTWLVIDQCNRLKIVKTANQNSPISQNLCPILVIDVWEHAYYLKHYNQRVNYICDWFEVVNWKKAQEKFNICTMCGKDNDDLGYAIMV